MGHMVSMRVIDMAIWLIMMRPLEWGSVVMLIHNIVSIMVVVV